MTDDWSDDFDAPEAAAVMHATYARLMDEYARRQAAFWGMTPEEYLSTYDVYAESEVEREPGARR